MIKGRVSIIIPSRNERYLTETVRDVLAKAAGDIEVIAVLDGCWDHRLPADPRVHQLHRGQALGMRPGINGAVQMARGEFLLKTDGHCMFAPGFDEILKADIERDWVVVPRRDRLDAENWRLQVTGKPPVDQHYLSYPFETLPDGSLKPGAGLHGTIWNDRAKQRLGVLIDEEMSSQGSCWFMTRAHWDRTFPTGLNDVDYGSFIQEFQEVGLHTWLSGGRVMVNKKTWYAHLHKGTSYSGADGKKGRGYFIDKREWDKGSKFAIEFWMQDRPFPGRVHNLRWLIERFWPVPTWPTDLDEAFRDIPAKVGRLEWAQRVA